MVRIVAYTYRGWAKELIYALWSQSAIRDINIRSYHEKKDTDALQFLRPDIVLFYGWSWMVPEDIIDNHLCICLHPSALPKYRGGSPIQNQIMDGLTESMVTLFQMNSELDSGPICYQKEISLKGNLRDVLLEIIHVGLQGTIKLIEDYRNNTLEFREQEGEPTYCKRKKPEESEITIEELQISTPEYLHNKIRGLQDPYPNAFITCVNGERLYITGAHCG